ncbi:hypothetical protein LMG33818_000177 [Halomonadaceae bacterium LMG 33818]|uniref:purine-cytosine permease family protein n=1 Tax=Cernens ardua TaxID=3402176 RepID=UPI003EDBAD5A
MVDKPAHIESRGIEIIPEKDRHSSPKEIGKVFFGAQMSYGALAMGGLPIVFGLGWWSALIAVVAGNLIGSVAVGLMALMGRKSGTNNTMTSVAYFGLRGRYIGSFITQVIDLGYFALMVWVASPPLIHTAHIVFGLPENQITLTLGVLIVALIMLTIAILGHATVTAWCKFTSYASLICFLILIAFGIRHLHGTPDPHIAPLALKSFWPTWMLALTVCISNGISYAPFASDYSRYTASDSSGSKMFWWVFLGVGAGSVISCLCGEILALSVHDPNQASTLMLAHLPVAILIPVVLIGFVGNASNAGMLAYNGMLDLQALLFKLSRFQVGLVFSVIGLLIGYFGLVKFNLTDSIVALCSIVTVLVTPWIVINLLGYLRQGERIDPQQLFAFGQHHSRYWYKSGFNLAAAITWVIAVIVGMLFSNTSIYVGPLSNAAYGVDLSFISAAIVGGVIYKLLDRRIRYRAVKAARKTKSAS